MRRMRVLMALASIAVIGLLAVSCGVPRSGKFAAIDPNNIPPALIETTTTPPPTTTTPEESTTTTIDATATTSVAQQVTLYFVSGTQISPFIDVLPLPLDPRQVLSALTRGPSGPVATGLRTAIPRASDFHTSVERGVAIVDVNQAFFDDMANQDQRLAIAQIVLSLTQMPGVGAVKFTLLGEPVSVFSWTGESSPPGQALNYEDYEQLLVTSPPATSSTTIAPAPVETTTTTVTTPPPVTG